VVNPKLNLNSVADVIREAKARPNGLSYGSFGNGSAAHLAGEYFKTLAGIELVHVPCKGSAPAGTDAAVVARLSETLDQILAQAETRNAIAQCGAVVAAGTPAQFAAFFAAEFDKWGKIVRQAGIKSE